MKEASKLDSIEEIKIEEKDLSNLSETYESVRSETSKILSSEKKNEDEKKRKSSFGKKRSSKTKI